MRNPLIFMHCSCIGVFSTMQSSKHIAEALANYAAYSNQGHHMAATSSTRVVQARQAQSPNHPKS
jgi:hypothetical protein